MEDARKREPGMMQAPWFRVMITCCGVLLVVAVCIELSRRIEQYGTRIVEAHPVNARIEISNPPAWLDRQIVSSLLAEAYEFAGRDEETYKRIRNVLDNNVLGDMGGVYMGRETAGGKTVRHQAAGYNAWIKEITLVRRELAKDNSAQTIQIFAQWRVPAAWVRVGDTAYLLDAEGTRLPGDYPVATRNAGTWMTLTGLQLPEIDGKSAVPAPGETWTAGASGRVGDDFTAGMKLIAALHAQKYVKQIESIDLTNFGGRKDARASWITLATIWKSDPAGGAGAGGAGVAHVVQWGRPIGEEKFYDWQAPEKLKTLDEIYQRFGRIDLGREYVDIHAEGVRIPHLASQADQPAQFLRG